MKQPHHTYRVLAKQSEPDSAILRNFDRKDAFKLVPVLLSLALLVGCTDNRKMPTQMDDPAYTHTFVLLDNASASGVENTATFSVRDTITDGRLLISGFFISDSGTKLGTTITRLWSDPNLAFYRDLTAQLAQFDQELLVLQGAILNIQIKATKTHQDSLDLDSLRGVASEMNGMRGTVEDVRDSLDTRLDDRFKVSFWLDGDATELYPRALHLNSDSAPGQLVGNETAVWGQGFFLAKSDTVWNVAKTAWKVQGGKTFKLDVKRFLVADATYHHPLKPARPTNLDTLPELFPITDWLTRLTPSSHTLHFRFSSVGTVSHISANLYVVYQTAG